MKVSVIKRILMYVVVICMIVAVSMTFAYADTGNEKIPGAEIPIINAPNPMKNHVGAWLEKNVQVAKTMTDYQLHYDVSGAKSTYYDSKNLKLKKSQRKLNCIDYVCWSLQRQGVLKKGEKFWLRFHEIRGKSAKKIQKSSKVRIKKYNYVYANTLIRKGKIKPGDIVHAVRMPKKVRVKVGKKYKYKTVYQRYHTMIYAGRDRKDQPTYYQVNNGRPTKGIKNGKLYYDRIIYNTPRNEKKYGNAKVAMVIRLTGLDYRTAFNVNTKAENGTITGSSSCSYGQSMTIRYCADPGYVFESVTVGGRTYDADAYAEGFVLEKIRSNQNVSVVFRKDESVNSDGEKPGGN